MTFCMKCDKIKMNKTVSVRSLIAIGSVDGKYMHSGVPSHAGGADADGVRQYAARCGCRILVYMICA